jgi:iron(III) transport system permease protein
MIETVNWHLLSNSLVVSGLAALAAGALGFAVALWLATIDPRWRFRVLTLVVASLALPPFLVTNTWIDLLGQNGFLHRWLPFNLYSLGGAVWLLALLTWPLTTLLTLGAWRKVEAAQMESDPALTGVALIRWLLWPAARQAVMQAAVVTFVLALNNFSVPVILQVPVFAEELWLALTARLDEAGAWTATIPLIAAPALVLLALRRTEFAWPRQQGPATAAALRRQLGTALRVGNAFLGMVLLLLSDGLPAMQLGLSPRTWSELPDLFRASLEVIVNSALYAAASATLCAAIGLTMWRVRLGPLLWLLFLVPGVLLGRGLIFAFNRPGVGVLYGTMAVVLFAFTLRYAALGWSGARLALQGVDRDLTDAVRLEGASGWTLFRLAEWPQIAPGILATWYVVYLLALWDVETLVLIYPPGGETLALRVFNLLHYGHNAQVNAQCLVLLGLAAAPLAAWRLWWFVTRRLNDQ